MTTLPKYYFRVRENGAAVYEVDTENRHRRIEMTQIATLNVRKGEIKPQRGPLSGEAEAAIEAWLADRKAYLARRSDDAVRETIDRMNLTAQWAQAEATPQEIEASADALLMAIHDLRTAIVRKKAAAIEAAGKPRAST